jgi:hypothetical protein
MYTQFSLHEEHVTEIHLRCFMAKASLPQTLPFLVVSGDQILAATGVFPVISDACLYLVHLKRLFLCLLHIVDIFQFCLKSDENETLYCQI